MAELDKTKTFDSHDTQRVWDALTERVEGFIEAWERGPEPPRLEAFVPGEQGPVRRMTLIELVKVDLEYRWKRKLAPRHVEAYVADFPDLADTRGVPCDLVYEEYHVRRQCDDPVDPEEYCQRFPEQTGELRRLLGLEQNHLTTSLFTADRPNRLQPGDEIDDFDLLARLGQGAFATVFLARQRSLGRLVALKVSADRGSEPQTLAQLDHANIVRIFDQRRLPDAGLRLLYMQYVAGGTLEGVVDAVRRTPPTERDGRLLVDAVGASLDQRGVSPPVESSFRLRLARASWPEAVALLGVQLAAALDYAHGRGVLHRDLKPANILLSPEGAAKLVDFNISFCSKLDGVTPAAYFGGSLAYMSPEQLEACNPRDDRLPASLDGRSDLYSLGVVLWELLAGERPFVDEALESGWPETLERMTDVRRLGITGEMRARLASRVPAELIDVITTLLAPDAASRYQSGREAAGQLELCLKPEAGRLLRPSRSGAKQWLRRFPLALILLAVVVPNAVAGWFNYVYNRDQIIDRLQNSQQVFFVTQAVINGIAFPLGIALAVLLARPIVLAVHARHRSQPLSEERLVAGRRRCLQLGHFAAGLGVAEWLMAGVAYPVALSTAGVALGWAEGVHFFGSLALCGLVAASYPFFGVTALGVSIYYPILLGAGSSEPREVALLAGLSRATWFYLALAVALPMLGVLLLVVLGGAQNRLAMIVLSAAGLMGLLAILVLARRIQSDLATLADVLTPGGDGLGTASESFSTGLGS